MNISNIRIGTRLALGFGLILVTMVTVIVLGLSRLSHISSLTDELVDTDWVKAEAAATIDATMKSNARRSMEIVLSSDLGSLDRAFAKIDANKKTINEAVATLDQLVRLPKGKELLAEYKTRRAEYVALFTQVGKLVREGQREQAQTLALSKMLPALDRAEEPMRQLNAFQKQIAANKGEIARTSVASAELLMMGLGVAAVLAGAGIAYWITQTIVKPLHTAVHIANTVAGGDLSCQIQVATQDEAGLLLQSLKAMNDGLVQIVSKVRTGTDTIATGSSQIAAGNLDLSARTEQQASALEETASAMEELTSTVQQNDEHARQANQLALAASEVAVRGGMVVSEVVETMASINDSSKQIVDIIAVIDGIAFQTNILALNAAVEAARAGEQGRGFAVVAQEVRTLAQRSAAAAKEIKALIDTSVEKVETGNKLVGQAGSTMDEIVQSIQRVSDIMSEISSATREQTAGIEQINQAIVEMDNVTQQNAALVEEASAAAQAMQEQASALSQTVSIFRVDARELAPVRPLAQIAAMAAGSSARAEAGGTPYRNELSQTR